MTTDIEALFAKAHRLHQNQQFPQAISYYEEVLTLAPNHLDTLRFLGLAHAQLNDMQHAIIYLRRALEQQPADASLHNNIANAYKKSFELDKALYHYQQALKLDPNYAQAHNNLASMYALQNDMKQALNHYRLAVHAQPDFVTAHFNLGLLLLKNNQLDAAKKQFKNVLALHPDHIEATFYLGVLLLESNQLALAENAFDDVLANDGEHVQALTNLGVIALKRDQGQLAIDYFTKALGFDNQHQDARNNLAATFIHHDRFENALMHYDVLLQQEPHNIEYLYNAGVAQMALGHLQEAIDHFETILALQNNHFATLNNLAAIQIRLGDRQQAVTLLERALAAHPTDEASQFMLHALTGQEKNPKASPAYVSNLFNNYALYYDQHLQGSLSYTLPQHIGRLLHRLKCNNIDYAIDLGCGTGLCGSILRELSNKLIGIDISPKMLAQATNKGLYDKLIEAELVNFLDYNTQSYQLAVAADVLPYLGELDTFFAAIRRRLSDKGLFIFSHEISETNPWTLQESARFSHHPDYIKTLCNQHGLKIIEQERVTARHQNQQPLEVMLYGIEAHDKHPN